MYMQDKNKLTVPKKYDSRLCTFRSQLNEARLKYSNTDF